VRNPTVRASGLANALALKSCEACSKAQSKACQDTQPAKQEVEHAQVSRQGPDASQKEPNITTFSRLVWPPWFLCWAEVSPSHPRALLHQSTGPLGATSCRRTVSRRRLSHETKRGDRQHKTNSQCFGTCGVVTAGGCLFVSSWGSARDGRTAGPATCQPKEHACRCHRATRQRREDSCPKQPSGRGIAPPHNMSIARHGCAHMRLSGRQRFKTALLVARRLRDIERSRRETARPRPLGTHAHDRLREMFTGSERLFLHGLLRTFSSPCHP
jgi:hypothetical protein